MHGGIVADGDPVADVDGVEIALAMEHGAVLHVGTGAHANGVYVASQNGIHPHRGLLAERNVADKLGGNVDVATGGKLGPVPLIVADHGCSTSRGARLSPFECKREVRWTS